MYTLIEDTELQPIYAIINFQDRTWASSDVTSSNWHHTVADALHYSFLPEYPFEPEVREDKKDLLMANYTSAEDYCAALRDNPHYVSPTIVCHFESPEHLRTSYPELFL